jgi:large conductance mechanosensitive channel protein
MYQEFISFILNFNVIGIAIGLIIATKIWELCKSLIEDLVVPAMLAPLFSKLWVKHLEDLSLNGVLYGKVIARLIDFLSTALIVFIFIKYSWLKPL